MKLRYKTFLYRLIQLVSILFLPALAQSKAEQDTVITKPLIWLKVGSDRTIEVTLSSDSSVVADPAKYRLVCREKNGKPFMIHCRNTKGKPINVAPKQLLPLTVLLGTEVLPTGKGGEKTLTLILMPGKGVSHAELILSIEDAQGNICTLLPYAWRARTTISTVLSSLGHLYSIGCTTLLTAALALFVAERLYPPIKDFI